MFLGLDLGTSGLRALLVDETGTTIGAAEAHYSVSHPHPGWSEQDPQHWLDALAATLAALRADHAGAVSKLRGIGISGHMHGATLIDEKGAVLRPCILWNDTRSHAEAAHLDATPQVRALSGNIVFPGFTAPKCMWVATHEPQVFASIAKVLLPKDYLSFWLTGRAVSEMSDAAGTSWLDVGARAWSDVLLTASGMRRDQMPDLVEGSQVAGTVDDSRAAQLGLPKGVLVVGGGGDNAAAACGVGALHEGQGFVSLGTSGVLLAARESFSPMPASAVHTFCHAIPGTWYQMGVILAATDSLNWLSGILETPAGDLAGTLDDHIGEPQQVRFLPYLSGERTPHNDSSIRGAFLGLDIGTDRAALVRSVMEGVSFALRDSLEALKSTGARLDRVLAIGGGARSAYWVELLATILDLPVDLPAQGEFGAALGAARLAICGVTGADPKKIMTPPLVQKTIQPRQDVSAQYEAAYQRFHASYPVLRQLQ
ncbi:xylulokinase [Sulfitobacter sp. MF3-043]|uniref:xylulokinase n=1 Tax=Sulfitobacter sediminivivens TaxID=3252902 RepID=UPI0036D85884